MSTTWNMVLAADGAVVWQLVDDYDGYLPPAAVMDVVGDRWPDGTPCFLVLDVAGNELGCYSTAAAARDRAECAYDEQQDRDDMLDWAAPVGVACDDTEDVAW